MDAARLARTLVHLKPGQIYGRLHQRLPRAAPRPKPTPARRALAGRWTPPVARPPSLVGPARLRLLNETGEVPTAGAWNDPARAKLWLYNLHYFDCLQAPAGPDDAGWRSSLLGRWVAENPPGMGNGWEPYPTSLRIVNWVKAALAGFEPSAEVLASLALQARWLSARLERHLLGNHLLANAKALVFAGLFFEGPDAERWAQAGFDLYAEQLPEQCLADGGHFERSPMYHAIILEDLLDLLNLARAFGRTGQPVAAALPARILAMQAWLSGMTHPDGRISFFNDAALGIAAEPGDLAAYAARLGLPAPAPAAQSLLQLMPSGYVRLEIGEAVALLDCAPIGPDYLPGHAHADTLSFEFSLAAERVLVNGGVSVYGDGPQRRWERSTAAHNTVEVDDQDSSEVWSGFRVGRRARVFGMSCGVADGAATVSAAHDGYRWRPGQPVHCRRWTLRADELSIRDSVEGAPDRATAHFHLHPDVDVSIDADGRGGELALANGRTIRWRTSAPAVLEAGEWSPEFGLRRPNRRLRVKVPGESLQTDFAW